MKPVYKLKQNNYKENRDKPVWNSIAKTNVNHSND